MKQIFILIFSLGLFTGMSPKKLCATSSNAEQRFSDQVNLALRQVGHQLLKIAGDEHSAIPPVEIMSTSEFRLLLEKPFDYDTLPYLLNQAFLSYKINRDYQVAVKQCGGTLLILGYNQTAFARGEVPCIGREQQVDCNHIIVTFTTPPESLAMTKTWLIPLFAFGLLGLISFGIFWKKNSASETPLSSPPDHSIQLGKFSFDHLNQTLQIEHQQHLLTYRENKLLYFFANHINEVLTRDTLIEEVWGKEGVIVGRSLDVFISRLRKLLKADESVQIKNVHGVGYRLALVSK